MFPDGEAAVGVQPTADLADLIRAVNSLDGNCGPAALIDQISLLEHLKASCAAAQASLTHAFAADQLADGLARKLPSEDTRRSIAAQIGLARRQSRHRGQRLTGVADALVTDMPHTLAALREGQTTERRATLIIEQLACLTREDRTNADARLAAELPGLGDRAATSRAAAVAYDLDPEAVMGKVRGAVKIGTSR